MDKLNCLCASENQVSDEGGDFDDISAYHERKQGLCIKNFMASYNFDGFEQGDESTHSIHHRKDTLPMQNISLMSYESGEQDEETRQKAPRGNRGLNKRVNSMDSHTASSADTYTTMSLSQSLMYDDDDDDEVCSTVTTEEVNNLQTPFRSKGRTDSNHDHEAYRYMQRMKPANYIRED
jgi:hypothetical protein